VAAKQIRKLNGLLDNCDTRTRSDQPGRRRTSTKDKVWASFIQRIRKHAASLHLALQNGWRCSCAHITLLRLEQRAATVKTAIFVLGHESSASRALTNGLRGTIKVVASLSEHVDVVSSTVPAEKPDLARVGYLSKLPSNIDLTSPQHRTLVVHNEIAFTQNQALKPASRFGRLRQRSSQPRESGCTKSQAVDNGCSV
jgi:hypothetical protein